MTFSNPIVAGEELIRSAIKSENYAAGTAGWRIAREGDAEFNDVEVRGTFSTVGPVYTVTIVDGQITISLNSNPVLSLTIIQNQLQFENSVSGRFFLEHIDNEGIGFRDSTRDSGIYYSWDEGFLVHASDTSPWTTGWTNLSLSNSWVADGETPQYRMMPDGTVVLRGNLKDGTTANGTVFGQLPAGFRPNTAHRFITAEKQTGLDYRHVRVSTNGDIDVWKCSTAHICIDGVRFPVT